MFTLYYYPGYCSLGDQIALEWIGAPYRLIRADDRLRNSVAYAKLNPSRTVPVLVTEDGWVLSQNVAILNFLAESYPGAHLNGDGSVRRRAIINRWLAYIAADVHKAFSPLLHPERIIGNDSSKEAILAHARSTLRMHFGVLDQQLQDNPWIAGPDRSIADPYLFVVLRWAHAVKVDLSDYDTLTAYYRRLRNDADVKVALAREQSGL
ncbi:glutathione S-transferase family protein [Hyphomicrobium sp.]|uniref:glutathione S-transferase family protein n=1 Tax=Hyphomicrobium sp. TaxID=82 RepID=UPI002FE32E7A